MKQKERLLENECRAFARSMGWVCAKLEKNGCTGIPDDLFISPSGQVWLVEFKKDGMQRLRHEQGVWFRRFPRLCARFDDLQTFKVFVEANC